MTRGWEKALLAVALAVAGLVGLTLLFAGPATYESLARDNGFATATFRVADDRGAVSAQRTELPRLLDLHARWVAFVTGRVEAPPSEPGVALFTADEYAHMADVRRVFIGSQVAAVAAAVGTIALLGRAARRGRSALAVLARDSAIAAGAAVAIVALAAALAFDQLFLAFHEIVFPQGNFLFGPDSNLLAIYPDAYWYGVTLRIGLTFVGTMAITAIGTAATLRQVRR